MRGLGLVGLDVKGMLTDELFAPLGMRSILPRYSIIKYRKWKQDWSMQPAAQDGFLLLTFPYSPYVTSTSLIFEDLTNPWILAQDASWWAHPLSDLLRWYPSSVPRKSPGSLHWGFGEQSWGFEHLHSWTPVCSKGSGDIEQVTNLLQSDVFILQNDENCYLEGLCVGGREIKSDTDRVLYAGTEQPSRATAVTFNLSWRPKTQAKPANSSCFPDTASEHSQES